MSYKNSVKIFSSNFLLVWKQLAYGLVCSGVVVLLSYLIAMPTIRLLDSQNWFSQVSDLFQVVYTSPRELNATFKDIIISFADILSNNFSSHWFSYIGFCLSAIVLPLYLVGLSRYVLCFILNSKISSLANVGFTNTFITNFKKASVYSLLKMTIDLAFGVVEILLFVAYLALADGVFLTVILLITFLVLVVFLESLKLTLLSSFAPLMIEENYSAIKAFKHSFKFGALNFGRTLSNSIIVIITIMAINIFFGVFTIGVGLFITIPATAVFISIFMVTNYYTMEGKRYYLTDSLIVEPKVLREKEAENIDKKGN